MTIWDPSRYLQFADDRARPLIDLISQVPTQPASIIDFGCGTGRATRHYRALWPDADILGIDSSADLVDVAIRENTDPGANYDFADLDSWVPHLPVDLVVANGVFQWDPDQFTTIDRLIERLTDSGCMAIQVSDNSDRPTHSALLEVASREPYKQALADVPRPRRIEPAEYLNHFAERGFAVNSWSTDYHHILKEEILAGPNAIFDWIFEVSARPYLHALTASQRAAFTQELQELVRAKYPSNSWGTIIPFRHTFAVAGPAH